MSSEKPEEEKPEEEPKAALLTLELLQLIGLTVDTVAEQIMDARNANKRHGEYVVIHLTWEQAERVLSVGSSVSALVTHLEES